MGIGNDWVWSCKWLELWSWSCKQQLYIGTLMWGIVIVILQIVIGINKSQIIGSFLTDTINTIHEEYYKNKKRNTINCQQSKFIINCLAQLSSADSVRLLGFLVFAYSCVHPCIIQLANFFFFLKENTTSNSTETNNSTGKHQQLETTPIHVTMLTQLVNYFFYFW